MLDSSIQDVDSIAKSIEVDVWKVQVTKPVLEEWLSSFYSLNFTLKPSGYITVDGVVTELWYDESGGINLHFSYVDPFEGDDKKSHPAVRWVNRVKAEVERYAALQPAKSPGG